jgi:hypothetical protein
MANMIHIEDFWSAVIRLSSGGNHRFGQSGARFTQHI